VGSFSHGNLRVLRLKTFFPLHVKWIMERLLSPSTGLRPMSRPCRSSLPLFSSLSTAKRRHSLFLLLSLPPVSDATIYVHQRRGALSLPSFETRSPRRLFWWHPPQRSKRLMRPFLFLPLAPEVTKQHLLFSACEQHRPAPDKAQPINFPPPSVVDRPFLFFPSWPDNHSEGRWQFLHFPTSKL